MSLPLPFYTLAERRPAPDQRAKVRARDHLGPYEIPFACKLVGGTWTSASTGAPLVVEVVDWRPLHAIDNPGTRRPGRLTFHDVRGQQV